MNVTFVNLIGRTDVLQFPKNTPICVVQLKYEEYASIPFEQLKFIHNGKSLLTFAYFFKTLEQIGIKENAIFHVLLRLGGPQPEERAIFQYLTKMRDTTFSIEQMETLFETKKDDIGIECPICMDYAVNRILSCKHWMCATCFANLNDKNCPFCRTNNVSIL